MAVTAVSERWEGRGATVDDQGVVTLTREFTILTDPDPITEREVSAALPVVKYQPHPGYPYAVAKTFSLKPGEGPTVWRASVTYTSAVMPARSGAPPAARDPANPQPPTEANNQGAAGPSRMPEFKFARRELKEAAEADVTGAPLVNTVGDRIEGLEVLKPLIAVTVSWWSVSIDLAHIKRYFDCVNETTWFGFEPWSLLVEDFTCDQTYDLVTPTTYGLLDKATVVLLWKPDAVGWKTKVLNAGRRERKSLSGNARLIPITDDTGQPVTEPYPLLASGEKWVTGQPYHYLTFEMKTVRDFAGLIV